MAWVLNTRLTFFSNAPYFWTKDVPTRVVWPELIPKYLNLICQIWQTHKSSFSDKINLLILDGTIDYIQVKSFVINPFPTNVPLLYLLKTSEKNFRKPPVFRCFQELWKWKIGWKLISYTLLAVAWTFYIEQPFYPFFLCCYLFLRV